MHNEILVFWTAYTAMSHLSHSWMVPRHLIRRKILKFLFISKNASHSQAPGQAPAPVTRLTPCPRPTDDPHVQCRLGYTLARASRPLQPAGGTQPRPYPAANSRLVVRLKGLGSRYEGTAPRSAPPPAMRTRPVRKGLPPRCAPNPGPRCPLNPACFPATANPAPEPGRGVWEFSSREGTSPPLGRQNSSRTSRRPSRSRCGKMSWSSCGVLVEFLWSSSCFGHLAKALLIPGLIRGEKLIQRGEGHSKGKPVLSCLPWATALYA
jgi:hypothetical protein